MPATAIVHTTDLAAAEDLSKGDLVRWGPSNATRYGEVYEIETDGEITSKTDGEGETTMEGTEDNPAFMIRHYEAGEDEWEETDTYTVHRADPLEKIDSLPDSVDNSARIILSSGHGNGPGGTPRDLGATFSSRVQDLIEAEASRRARGEDIAQEEARNEVEDELQEAAGISDTPFRNVLQGEVQCPFTNLDDPRAIFAEWAEILSSTQSELVSAAESDGCSYSEDNSASSGPKSAESVAIIAGECEPCGDGQASAEPEVQVHDGNDLGVTDLRSAAQDLNPIDLAVNRGRVTELDASEDDVAQINERHGLDLSPSEVQMFRDFAASTGPMRGKRLRFTRSALERFQTLMQKGRPYVLHHNPDRFVGSTLRASIVEDTEVRGFEGDWLAIDWFAVTRDATEQRRQDLMDVRTGLQYTSIRFTGGEWEMMSEEVGGEEVRFMLVDDNPPESQQTSFDRLDAMHVSRVELGAVKGAGATPTD